MKFPGFVEKIGLWRIALIFVAFVGLFYFVEALALSEKIWWFAIFVGAIFLVPYFFKASVGKGSLEIKWTEIKPIEELEELCWYWFSRNSGDDLANCVGGLHLTQKQAVGIFQVENLAGEKRIGFFNPAKNAKNFILSPLRTFEELNRFHGNIDVDSMALKYIPYKEEPDILKLIAEHGVEVIAPLMGKKVEEKTGGT